MGRPGFGRKGYCSICVSPNAAEYIKGARTGGKSGDGWNAAEFRVFAEKNGEGWSRQTFYEHKRHSKSPEMRVIQAAQLVRSGEKGVAISKRSNTDVLEAIRDIGAQRALDNPDNVSIDHSLKAIQILEGRKDRGSDALNILVQFTVGQPPVVIIEGTAREVPPEKEEDDRTVGLSA